MTITSNTILRTALVATLGLSCLTASAEPTTPNTIVETTQNAAADSAPAVTGEARPLDRIVAVVNNDVITEFELQTRVRQVAMNLRQNNVGLPPMQALRAQVLERLILEKAIEQRARELGIRVDEQMVSASIDMIARSNKITTDELRARLAADGIPYPAFRKQIREEIIAQRLREREVDSKINIPESEVDAYLAEKAGFTGSDTREYHVQHILLPLPADTNDRDAMRDIENQAEKILELARKGEDFGKLAAEYSKSGDALEGGDLGWRDSQRLPSLFWQAIRDNNKRDFVTMTRSQNALHIIKVLGERDGVQAKLAGAPIEQTHVRHILMFVSDLMPEGQVVQRLHDIKQRIAEGKGDFATYARLNSVDNSATRGGDLGWISAGDTVPAFESAMNRLEPGEVSDPVKTQYGYHLIQVVERRTQAADAKRQRYVAMQALREKKIAESVTDWQRELRDKAYVEIRRENL